MYKVNPQLDFKHQFHSRYYDICRKFRVGNRLVGEAVNTVKTYENTDLIKYQVIDFIKDVMFVSPSRLENK